MNCHNIVLATRAMDSHYRALFSLPALPDIALTARATGSHYRTLLSLPKHYRTLFSLTEQYWTLFSLPEQGLHTTTRARILTAVLTTRARDSHYRALFITTRARDSHYRALLSPTNYQSKGFSLPGIVITTTARDSHYRALLSLPEQGILTTGHCYHYQSSLTLLFDYDP